MVQAFEKVLTPAPQRMTRYAARMTWPENITVAIHGIRDASAWVGWTQLQGDLKHHLNRQATLVDDAAAATIVLTLAPAPGSLQMLPDEGYALEVTPERVAVLAPAMHGLFHGVQTLCQLLAINYAPGGTRPSMQCCEMTDWPTLARRWLMPDLGRSVFSPALLRRMVRIAARLKCNGLHLHLHENEMNPVRYDDLPLGSENPHAQPISAFADLIAYAKQYHVEIIPELESWGHVGSLLQHYPHLYGASRPAGYGHSFAIGPDTFDLLERIYDPWCAIVPDGSIMHMGLDEANFRLGDGADPVAYNPRTIVAHVHERLQRRARAHGKQVRMMIWGGGIKYPDVYVPPELREDILMGPWCYRTAQGAYDQMLRHWVRDSKRFSPEGKMRSPFMGGAGTTGIHESGCYEATLAFCRLAMEYPNCEGVDIMNWGSNDIHGRLSGLWFGAAAAWNPVAAEAMMKRDMVIDMAADESTAALTHLTRTWQSGCPDADPASINADRGEEILLGRYRWGSRREQYVVPLWMPEESLRGDQDKHIIAAANAGTLAAV